RWYCCPARTWSSGVCVCADPSAATKKAMPTSRKRRAIAGLSPQNWRRGLLAFRQREPAVPLADDDGAVDGHIGKAIHLAARPTDLDRRDRWRLAETEVRAQIGLREVTRAATDFFHPRGACGSDRHARADPIAIAFAADQANGQPVLRIAASVLEETRGAIDVGDQRVEIAVVIVIADRQAAAGSWPHGRGAHRCCYLGERAVPCVLEQHRRFGIGLVELVLIDLGIDMPVDEQQILPAV